MRTHDLSTRPTPKQLQKRVTFAHGCLIARELGMSVAKTARRFGVSPQKVRVHLMWGDAQRAKLPPDEDAVREAKERSRRAGAAYQSEMREARLAREYEEEIDAGL